MNTFAEEIIMSYLLSCFGAYRFRVGDFASVVALYPLYPCFDLSK
jgi:hypothetical protein